MKNVSVFALLMYVMPLFGYLPKVSFEYIATYEDRGMWGGRKGSKVSGICIDTEVYEPEVVRCENGPICFCYYRVLKQDKAKRELSVATEALLDKYLLKSPVVKKSAAKDPVMEKAYEFGCECVDFIKSYRYEIGRLFMEYNDEGEPIERLKPLCDLYNKVVSLRAWRRLSSRGGQLDLAMLELGTALRKSWICCLVDGVSSSCYNGKPDPRLYVKPSDQSALMSAIENAYGILIDRVLKRSKGLEFKEDAVVKDAQKEARKARKMAQEANELAIEAMIESKRATMNSNGENTGFLIIPSGSGKVRIMGGGGTAGVR